MGFRLPGVVSSKMLKRSLSNSKKAIEVPKVHLAVYVGETEMMRFVIPVSFLNQPSFQELLAQAEEEYGFEHPMGALTIPCTDDTFNDLISNMNVL